MDIDDSQAELVVDWRWRMARRVALTAAASIALAFLPSCSGSGSAACGLNIGGLPVPECTSGPAFVPSSCEELVAANFLWSLRGFSEADILNASDRSQRELTAILPVGQSRSLRVSAGSVATATGSDCSGKAVSIEWVVTNLQVARVEVGADRRQAELVAVSPGETGVHANLTFADGTPPERALPFVFRDVTVVRVVPQ
jgi:hypothetical protein